VDTLQDQIAAELKAAKAIAAKYPIGTEISPEDLDTANAHLKRVDELKAKQQKGIESDGVKAALAAIGIDLGLDGPTKYATTVKPTAGVSTKFAVETWGRELETLMREKAGATQGAKALIGNTISTPSPIANDPVLIDGRPTTILDLIPRRPKPRTGAFDIQDGGDTFDWLYQAGRTNNASSVPDGARKPVSGAAFEAKSDRFRTYATLTDPMPKRYLDDWKQIIEILKQQLAEGVIESLEADVVNGTGTPIPEVLDGDGNVTTQGRDPVKGILQTSGIRAQAYTSNVLTTLSNARYTLTDAHETPNAWVMNSRDYQALELMREDGATGPLLFGTGRTGIEQYLGDYPIVTSPLITQGTALLGDFTKTELIPRGDDTLDVDGSGELFKRNQVIFRREGRYGFAVLKPLAFIQVDLTA
jgi:HK97 family phage major capsid protein